jgi:hypothetical protein
MLDLRSASDSRRDVPAKCGSAKSEEPARHLCAAGVAHDLEHPYTDVPGRHTREVMRHGHVDQEREDENICGDNICKAANENSDD